jgi:thymidylate kinase
MPFIAFLGCDGSGKSAVITRVDERLRAEGVPVTLGHWRPKAIPSALNKGAASADDPHGCRPRALVPSLLKLGWLWSQWWLGWWKSLAAQSRHGVVLFDRFHADLLVDPARYRYGGPIILAKLASSWMPQPDRVFFLDASPDVLLSRKQEVTREALERSRAAYLALAREHPRFRIVDASMPLDDVVAEIETEIRSAISQPNHGTPV